MKNRKTHLLRGLLVLLAAALVLAAALPGLGLSTGGPTPLPQAQADPLRPEGQSQSPQTPPDQPEEPDTPQEPDTPDEPQEPEQPDTPDQPDQPDTPQDPDTPPEDPGQDPDPDAPPKDDGPRDDISRRRCRGGCRLSATKRSRLPS